MHIPSCPLFESFEVCFESLFNAGRCLAFPCDSGGHVDIDALSPRARQNYLYARALIGRDFSYPRVRVAANRAVAGLAHCFDAGMAVAG